MEFIEISKVALRALNTNKIRSSLTMLGIIIGVASVILLVSIGTGIKTYITQQLEGLGSNLVMVIPGHFEFTAGGGGGGGTPGAGAASSKLTIDQSKDILKKTSTAVRVMPYTENNGTIKYKDKTHTTQVAGVTYVYQEIRNQFVNQGRFFTPSQENAAKKVVVLGKTVAEEVFGNEDPVNKIVTISDQSYKVLGVLEPKGAMAGVDMDNQMFIPVTTALKQYDMENVQAFWIESESPETVEKTKIEVENVLKKTLDEDDFSVLDTKSLLTVVSSILGALTAALAGIAAISLVVGGIGIMNIMLVSVTERTREIGLRKAVGATQNDILGQFLIESVVLSVVGGLIGILIGTIFSAIIGHFLNTSITLWSVTIAFFVSAAVGIVFGVAPAAKAAKLNPIDALRYE
jgi:putative ABC transport system permease protein